jgi:NitT/TauT family transport system permease protein
MNSNQLLKTSSLRKRCLPKLSLRGNKGLYGVIGVIIFLAGWQVLSMVFREVVVASPLAALRALLGLASGGTMWEYLLITLGRLFIGLLIGSTLGLGLGLVAGLHPRIRLMLEPLRWIAMTIPAVVIAVIAMLWFGLGGIPVVFVAVIIITPITYVNATEGLLGIDDKIVEMGHVFKVPRKLFLADIYLPGIAASVIAGLTLTAGMGVRVVVLAELMGAHNGIGHGFSRAWTCLNTPELFAWISLCLVLMSILEFGILRPIKNRLMRWKMVE